MSPSATQNGDYSMSYPISDSIRTLLCPDTEMIRAPFRPISIQGLALPVDGQLYPNSSLAPAPFPTPINANT